MKEYTLTPFQQQKNIQVTVPGSKSITNRALLLAALAKGTTTLQGVLFSDDSRVFMEALKSLGYTLSIQECRLHHRGRKSRSLRRRYM